MQCAINIFFFFAIMLSAVTLHAQKVVVRDRVTRAPLEFVTISSSRIGEFVATDREGKADISAFAGLDSIRFSIVGYENRMLSYEALEKEGFQVFLRESLFTLEEVVVAASRWEQRRRDIPFRMATLPARKVAFQQPQTAADLLAASGEVFVQKSQLGGGSPMIRGFATNRVLLVVDGVRMNTAIFRSGNLQNVIALDPRAIANTEIIFGPNSVIYGSDAIGGVMNFSTLLPKLSGGDNNLLQANAMLRYASANFEKTAHLDFNFGGRRWASVTSITFSDFDDLRMGGDGPDDYLRREFQERVAGADRVFPNDDPEVQKPTGYDQINLMQKVRFRPNERWDFRYGLHYSTTSDVPRYDRLTRRSNGQFTEGDWYYGPQRWQMNNLQAIYDPDGRFFDRARLTLAQQFFEESRHDRDFGGVELRHRTEKVYAYSANLDFEKQWREDGKFFYGLEALWNNVSSEASIENIETGGERPTNTRYPDGADWNSYALYVNARKDLHPQLTAVGGIRYNVVDLEAAFDTAFFDFPFTQAALTQGAITGNLGFTFRPWEGWQFNLNGATGFRAPNIDDIGKVFDSEPGSVVVPNPDLRPEYAYSLDFGVVRTIGERLRVDLTAYYTFLDDALVRRDFRLDGRDSIFYDGELSQVQAIQNTGEAEVWGLQMGLEWQLPAGFSFEADFSIQEGEQRSEDEGGEAEPLRHVAPWFGQAHLIYQRDRLKVDCYGIYNNPIPFNELAPSERGKPFLYALDDRGNPYAPSWFTLNLKASYQLNDWLQFNAGLENITDQRYRPYSSGIAAPGRNLILAVKGRF